MSNHSTLQTAEQTELIFPQCTWHLISKRLFSKPKKKADPEDRPFPESRPVQTASCLASSTVSSVNTRDKKAKQ